LSAETSRGLVKTPSSKISETGVPKEYITLKEVGKHNLSQDAWVIINGKVFEGAPYSTALTSY
jgi:cytochrome b involved in lipid metabolism